MRIDESVERPLRDLRVIEFEALGPGPLAGHMLSNLGARVTVVARRLFPQSIAHSIEEAVDHPHNQARGLYQKTMSGLVRTRGAPRFLPLPA